MSNSHKSLVTQIQADEKVVLANERAMEKVRSQFQCKCTHRDANGSFALIVPSGPNAKKSPYTGAPLYRCRICKKELDISNIGEDEFARALNCIDRVFDLGKMHLDLRSEKDQETLGTLSKQQYRATNTLPDVYKTIRKGGRKNKNKNKNPMGDVMEVRR